MTIKKSFESTTSIGGAGDPGAPPVVGDVYVVATGSRDVIERHTLVLTPTGWNGSLTVVARRTGSSSPFQPVEYNGRCVNGVAGTAAPGNAALTTSSLITVDASGLEYGFQIGAYAAGSMLVEVALTRAA